MLVPHGAGFDPELRFLSVCSVRVFYLGVLVNCLNARILAGGSRGHVCFFLLHLYFFFFNISFILISRVL